MTRINFKNLPDKTTPINADNLNKLNNLAIDTEVGEHEEEVVLIKENSKKTEIYANKEKYTDTVNIGTDSNNAGVWVEASENILNVSNYTPSKSGLTTTMRNGKLVVNGTPTSGYAEIWSIPANDFTNMLESGATYTLSSTNYSTKLYVVITQTNISSGAQTYISCNDTAKTFTVDKSKFKYYIDIQCGSVSATGTLSNFEIGVQLEKGTYASSFKPYTTPRIKANVNGDYRTIAYKNVYSTGENVIGEWLGKPLYRKVIDFGALPNNTDKAVKHNISDLDTIVNLSGIAIKTDNTIFTLPYAANGAASISLYANNSNVDVITYTDRSNITKCYITLEYTKTTDTGVSLLSLDE